jgi:hypothetical protein
VSRLSRVVLFAADLFKLADMLWSVLTEKSDGAISRINVLSFVQELVKCDKIGQ